MELLVSKQLDDDYTKPALAHTDLFANHFWLQTRQQPVNIGLHNIEDEHATSGKPSRLQTNQDSAWDHLLAELGYGGVEARKLILIQFKKLFLLGVDPEWFREG